MSQRVIIVGTDGTDSVAAVSWAAGEARRRGLRLRIVHAFDWGRHESRLRTRNEYIDVARNLADAVVADAYDHAREIAPDANITTETLIGHPVPRLLEVSRGAELLVLGSRGRGGFTGLRLGSVSQRMATHAACPVVVVRGRAVPDGPVVAGVDDSATGEQVLAAAFEAAADRGRPLTVVHSHLAPVPFWVTDVPPATAIAYPERDAADRDRLEERLSPWRGKYPRVPVEIALTHDGAACVLVDASRTAQLVVVGPARGGAVSRTLLGSTVLQLLHHADCPVLIARQDRGSTR